MTVDIVGGGFSGLMQAFYLVEAGYSVRLFERDIRLGGLLGSVQREGFLIEQGANAFISNYELERVAKIIKVPLVKKLPSATKRFVFDQGEMKRWPLGWRDSFSIGGFILNWKWRKKKIEPKLDESLRTWGYRCLGEGVTDKLLEPAMQGVYATSADQLNAHLIYKSLTKKSRRGKTRGSVAPLKGMQQWLDGVIDYLKSNGAEILFEDYFASDQSNPVIYAVGLDALKALTNSKKIQLSEQILKTESVSLTSVFLGYPESTEFKSEGFGCLFPRGQNFHSLGVLFNHNIFSGRAKGGVSETWILNDDKMSFSEMSQDGLLRYIVGDRYQLTKVSEEPTQVSVHQWPHRIPLYNQQLRVFLQEQEVVKNDFLLVGNYLGDLGLSKILFKAKANVEKIEGGYFA